jgi:hypothetical protein
MLAVRDVAEAFARTRPDAQVRLCHCRVSLVVPPDR